MTYKLLVDLIMMLVVRPGDSRDHSANLELLRTLFEREVGVVNLSYNSLIVVLAAALTLFVSQLPAAFTELTINTLLTPIGGFVVLIGIAWWLRRQDQKRKLIRRHYLELIRLYYLLNQVI